MLGARVVSGAGLVCDLVGLDEALAGADLAITGEGALDEQTLHGKAPAEVAARARAAGVPCLALAGVVALSPDQLTAAGFVTAAHALTDVEPDVARCLAEPGADPGRLAADVVPPLVTLAFRADQGGRFPHGQRGAALPVMTSAAGRWCSSTSGPPACGYQALLWALREAQRAGCRPCSP